MQCAFEGKQAKKEYHKKKRKQTNRFTMKYLKPAIQIALVLVILVLIYFVYESIMEPVRFEKEKNLREEAVIQRLKDIRSAQLVHRTVHGRFNTSLDSLIEFAKTKDMPVIKAIGNVPDTLTEAEALKMGLVQRDTIWVSIKDSLFRDSKYPLDSLSVIPFSGGETFKLDAGEIERGYVKVQVFEAIANREQYMKGLDFKVWYQRQDGLKVGSMVEPSTDGNWE